MDVAEPGIREMARDIGLKLDEPGRMREPHVVFFYRESVLEGT